MGIPLMLLPWNEERGSLRTLDLAKTLHRIRTACAFSLLVDTVNETALNVASEAVEGFATASVFCFSNECLDAINPDLIPIGSINIIFPEGAFQSGVWFWIDFHYLQHKTINY